MSVNDPKVAGRCHLTFEFDRNSDALILSFSFVDSPSLDFSVASVAGLPLLDLPFVKSMLFVIVKRELVNLTLPFCIRECIVGDDVHDEDETMPITDVRVIGMSELLPPSYKLIQKTIDDATIANINPSVCVLHMHASSYLHTRTLSTRTSILSAWYCCECACRVCHCICVTHVHVSIICPSQTRTSCTQMTKLYVNVCLNIGLKSIVISTLAAADVTCVT